MSGIHDVPDLTISKPDGSRFSRLEMESQIRQVWTKPHTWRLKANSVYGLPNKDSFRLRPISVLHWILDEQLRRSEILGEELGIKPDQETEPAHITQITQRLADFIQRGLALKPKEGEGIDMSDLTRFTAPAPVTGASNTPAFVPPPFPSTGPTPTPPSFASAPPMPSFNPPPGMPAPASGPTGVAPMPPGMSGSPIPPPVPDASANEPKRRGKRATTTSEAPLPGAAPMPLPTPTTPGLPIPPQIAQATTGADLGPMLNKIKEMVGEGSPEILSRLTTLEGMIMKQDRKLALIDAALSLLVGQMYGKLGSGTAANLEAMLAAVGLNLPQ